MPSRPRVCHREQVSSPEASRRWRLFRARPSASFITACRGIGSSHPAPPARRRERIPRREHGPSVHMRWSAAPQVRARTLVRQHPARPHDARPFSGAWRLLVHAAVRPAFPRRRRFHPRLQRLRWRVYHRRVRHYFARLSKIPLITRCAAAIPIRHSLALWAEPRPGQARWCGAAGAGGAMRRERRWAAPTPLSRPGCLGGIEYRS